MRKVLALSVAALLTAAVPAAASLGRYSPKGAVPELASGGGSAAAAPSGRIDGRAQIDPFLAGELEKGEAVVIVNASSFDAATAAIDAAGLPVLMEFPKADAAVTKASAEHVRGLAKADGIVYLEGNRPVRHMLATAVEAVRIPVAEQEFDTAHTVTRPSTAGRSGRPHAKKTETGTIPARGTLDGRGVGVAIVDSGVAADHQMFVGRIARNLKQVCLPIVCPNPEANASDQWFVEAGATDTDSGLGGGHGTHVTGIAAGGRVSMADGTAIRGAAPGASIYGLGSGLGLFVLNPAASLNWVLEHHADPCGGEAGPTPECPAIKVVNNSYGSVSEYNPNGVYEKISDRLAREGVVVVWAAGNGDELNDGGNGSDNRTNGPGASPVPGVLMVANYSDGETGSRSGGLNSSSSRGEKGRPETYPDLSSPGTNITSACRITLAICSPHPDDPDFGTISGTSMAAPLVAGAVALLRQAHPEATSAQIEEALENSAFKFGDASSYEADVTSTGEVRNPSDTTSFDKGHGLLDVANALRYLDGRSMDGRTAPACPAGGVVLSDPEGDATKVALVDAGESAYSPARDITSIAVANAGDGKVTFTISVASLSDAANDGPGGVTLEAAFAAGGGNHEIVAKRNAAGLTSFTADGVSTVGDKAITGEFRPGTPGVVTMTVPREVFEPDLHGTVTFSGFSFYTRYDSGALLAPVSDDGAGDGCVTFAVGGTAPATEDDPTHVPGDDPTSPHEGEASAEAPYAWDGEVPETINPTSDLGLGCLTADDFRCDNTRVLVNVPQAGGFVTVTISFPEGEDFELYVFGKDGTYVGESATANPKEQLRFFAPAPGVYTISVSSYISSSPTYSGTVTLD